MDINLHSFILVVGLIVILFIVVDGIKKVRQARSNQFEDDVLNADVLTSELPIDDGLSETNFREFEIADDLVKDSFVTDAPEKFTSKSDHSKVESDYSTDSVSYAEAKHGDASLGDSVPTEMVSESLPESDVDTELNDSAPLIVDKVDTLLHSAQPSTNKVEPELEVLESFSVNESTEPTPAATIKPAPHPRKVHTNQPSKAEVESRRREIEQSQTEAPKTIPLEDVPEAVPVLMEPVELGGEVDPNPPVQQEMHLPEFVQQTLNEEPIIAVESEPDFESFSIDDVEHFGVDPVDQAVSEKAPKAATIVVGEKLSERPAAEEIFVINVLKESQPLLKGADLHHIFKVCDMRHGEMDIFHRFEKENAQGKIQFSVVDALTPGTFDLNTIDTMETKGISMFMSLPGPEDPMAAFDAMAEVALVFARNFNANLYDESHSDLTPQTLEHYRNRIREYARKQFSKK